MQQDAKNFGRKLFFILALLAVALAVGGVVSISQQRDHARQAAYRELSAVAELEAQQIRNWRQERLQDARFFSNARFAAQDLEGFIADPNSASNRAAISDWLGLLKGGNRYEAVMVFNEQSEKLFSIPSGATESRENIRVLVERARKARGEVSMTDFYRHQEEVRALILVPIYRMDDHARTEPIASLLLRLDPRQFVLPVLRFWPEPFRTGRVSLLRQEGDGLLYVTDIPTRPGASMAIRTPPNLASLTSATIIKGRNDFSEGPDYRGIDVVTVARHIPDTTWVVLAQEDQSEIYRPLYMISALTAAGLGTIFTLGASLLLLVWKRHTTSLFRRELALQKEHVAMADRVQLLMRNANDIIMVVDPGGRVIEANECALRGYGYNLEEIRQKDLNDLRAPETRGDLNEDLQRVKETGAVSFETVHCRRDGTVFPVEVRSRWVDLGRESYILTIVRDITQRRNFEREIARLNRLYDALNKVNHSMVRAESRQELFETTCRVLVEHGGFQMAWIGWIDSQTKEVKPVAQAGDRSNYLSQIKVFADGRPEGRGPLGNAIRTGGACVCDDVATDPMMAPWREAAERSGSLSVAAFPVREEGEIRGALALYCEHKHAFGSKELALLERGAADLSFALDKLIANQRRYDAEQSLRALNMELEERVRERTAELESKNQSLQAFAYSVSHDLKAPVRSILGYGEILLSGSEELNAETRGFLNKIDQSARRMNSLIDDLLTFSRLELQEVRSSAVSISDVVQSILEEFRGETDQFGTQVHLDIRAPLVETDRSSLTQALRNLIGNAVKFSGRTAHPEIWIRAGQRARDILFEVRDNGIGFDQRHCEKMFELFERCDNGDSYPGTGIGLAIVRRAVNRMNGRVWAEGKLGLGAAFFLQIPIRDSASG